MSPSPHPPEPVVVALFASSPVVAFAFDAAPPTPNPVSSSMSEPVPAVAHAPTSNIDRTSKVRMVCEKNEP